MNNLQAANETIRMHKKNLASLLVSLGQQLVEQQNYPQAFAAYSQALSFDNESIPTMDNLLHLANLLIDRMEFHLADECLQEIIKYPAGFPYYQALLLLSHYFPHYQPDDILIKHLAWANTVEKNNPIRHQHTKRYPHKRVRIGYISPDFCAHPVSCFFGPILRQHNSELFEVFCYANVETPDIITDMFKKQAEHWRDFNNMQNSDLLTLIMNDEIDILVDLAGHTERNRLFVFCGKPAPIQMSWIGYPDTTGLKAIDYRITDEFCDPIGITDQFHSEQLLRLPGCFLCFCPVNSAAISSLPALKNNCITFGFYNKLKKVTTETLLLWAKILRTLPQSRLIIKTNIADDNALTSQINNLFLQQGVASSQIVFRNSTKSHQDHLASFNDVDIILDSLRYSGTTSTCEALWMGVPVITLAGPTHFSRVSGSLLRTVGLPDLVASTKTHYVEIACHLASDLPRLNHIRQNLRQVMKNSPLMDGKAFTSKLETCFLHVLNKHFPSH